LKYTIGFDVELIQVLLFVSYKSSNGDYFYIAGLDFIIFVYITSKVSYTYKFK